MENLEVIKSKVGGFTIGDYYRYLGLFQKEADLSGHKTLRLSILRSYTIEMMEPILKLRLMLEGYLPEIFIGEFNHYSQEMLDSSSPLYHFKPDVILVMVRLEDILPPFVWEFEAKTLPEWDRAIDSTASHLIHLTDTVARNTNAQIIVQNFALCAPPFWGIYDAQHYQSQTRLVHELNARVAAAFQKSPNTYIWAFHDFLLRKGYETLYDPKMWYVSRNPYKQSGYIKIVDDLKKYILSALGKGKKCIVLDLDNTLWGGIIGEDGLAGIALGHDYPGNCYIDLQRELLKLYHRGIILAINSKNNETDAWEVFDKHPSMILRRRHIAAYQINWNDKASNLKLLARELNIGVESMIFIDDNPVECELVRQQCPKCAVVQVPEKPYLIPALIHKLPYIENIRLTSEDRKKGEIYQAQSARNKLEKDCGDISDFLKYLELEVEIKIADDFTIPRIAQLTQKTNQLNMTTHRYSEGDILELSLSPESHVFSVDCKDRFGANGIVGVFILKIMNSECHIDSFLLSCRVIGRTIEQSMVAFIAGFASKKDAVVLKGEFTPTKKNQPASDIYAKLGFRKTDEGMYTADLREHLFEYSPFIKLGLKP